MIEIVYFARLREQVGTGRERIGLPPGVAVAGDLIDYLRARDGPWADALDPGARLMVAVNQDLAQWQTPVRDGDEVALFPPVTGG